MLWVKPDRSVNNNVRLEINLMLMRILRWLLVLLVGAFLIEIFQRQISSIAGSGMGTGVFKHHFQSSINFNPDPEADDGIMGSVFIEAEHPKTFMLSGHNSPKYKRARFRWHIFSENESSGEAWIDLNQMTLTHNGKTVHVNTANLLNLFGFESAAKKDVNILDAFVDLLHAAKSGLLPPPRHHIYELEDPLNGHFQHGASGYSVPYLTSIFAIGWSLVGCFGLWNSLKNRKPYKRPNQSP